MNRIKKVGLAVGGALAAVAVAVAVLALRTEADISRHHAAVAQAGRGSPSVVGPVPARAELGPGAQAQDWAALPEPVRRYFAYTFRGQTPRLAFVEMQMQGEFRRPRTQAFTPTSASQTVAVGTPAMMFAATTHVLPGVWARAYNAYVDGRMEMKAKVMSAVALVDEKSSPELDRISLRRWLLESPLYPMALLPGGGVRWEAIDGQRARAVVTFNGISAAMAASFDDDGRLTRMDAEADGDLNTPYHGSGEHVGRSDYQEVDGIMIPMAFVIARAAGGQLHPFWRGRVTHIRYSSPSAVPTDSVALAAMP